MLGASRGPNQSPLAGLTRKQQMLYSGQLLRDYFMPDALCKHQQKRLIAKDDDSQYWECLGCGEILEAGELPAGPPPVPLAESPSGSQKQPGFDESLSDA